MCALSLAGPTVRRGDQSSCTVIGPANDKSLAGPLESASIFHRTFPIASGPANDSGEFLGYPLNLNFLYHLNSIKNINHL